MSPTLLAIFKLTVTPILVGLASLAARRWGNAIAGLITGFPLMTGPISVFLAIEQGATFTVAATTGILIALIGVAVYAAVYALVARFAAWPAAIAAAYIAFFATGWAVQPVADTLWKAAAGAYCAILLSVIVIPRFAGAGGTARVPYWEIWLRMFATAAMIAIVTTIAKLVGPAWTGIIATIPVMGTVMAVFTHGRWGAEAVTTFLRSMMLSMFSFATFFVVVALGLERFGIVATYIAATLVAVSLSPIVVRIDRLLAAPARA